jgi:hypothetical protein
MDPIDEVIASLKNARDAAEELSPEKVAGLNAAITIAEDVRKDRALDSWMEEHDH